jgi:hypothetical protein
MSWNADGLKGLGMRDSPAGLMMLGFVLVQGAGRGRLGRCGPLVCARHLGRVPFLGIDNNFTQKLSLRDPIALVRSGRRAPGCSTS